MTSKYLRTYNFNPWNQHIDDCAIRAIVAASGLCYEEVCRRLGFKFKIGHGIVRKSGTSLDDIEAKFGDFFDIVEDYYDNQNFVPDEFKNSQEASDMDAIDAALGIDAVSEDSLQDFLEDYRGQGVFLVSLVGNENAENQTARAGGHIVAAFCVRGHEPFFVDTWDSHEMKVDSFMRVKKQIPKSDPLHYKAVWILKSRNLNEAKPSIKKFVKALKKGKVEFTYKKRNGKIRKAVGTLNKNLMPKEMKDYKPKHLRKIPEKSIVYYDLGKMQFRSFKEWLLQNAKLRK